jgi:hypothetical protein
MPCPVCAAQAKNLTPATYDGVVVGCPGYGDYQVTGTVFNKLLRLAPEYRHGRSSESKGEDFSGSATDHQHNMLLNRLDAQMRTVTNRSAIVLMTSVLVLGCCAPDQASARTFGGFECTDDCVGHAAGYRWAEMNAIADTDDCPEKLSDEFYEGCLAYVDDPDRGADFDDDGRPIRATKRASN